MLPKEDIVTKEIKMTVKNVNVPLLLREKLGENFEPDKIVGYQYSIGYTTEDWDFPIENYYCEKEEHWADGVQKKIGAGKDLEELEDLSKWDKELIGRVASKHRGYYEEFYTADNGQWPSLLWACIDVYLADGKNDEPIRIKVNDREDVVYGAFEELRLWLENRFKKTDSPCADAWRHIRLSVSSILTRLRAKRLKQNR